MVSACIAGVRHSRALADRGLGVRVRLGQVVRGVFGEVAGERAGQRELRTKNAPSESRRELDELQIFCRCLSYTGPPGWP